MPSVLTKREREVFELLIKNNSTQEIGELLFISEKTVRNHKGENHAIENEV